MSSQVKIGGFRFGFKRPENLFQNKIKARHDKITLLENLSKQQQQQQQSSMTERQIAKMNFQQTMGD
uniref:Baculovirus repeated ORF b n=1 Tax=Lymantria dispar multicapsid nuclear polyhedrosis virus TaxID=10449 RepID=A0A1B1MQQ0_NPVLD|nr:baculovirus repeated ORF b [Lymantria dispar multiple nucleopolyhedrovirus]